MSTPNVISVPDIQSGFIPQLWKGEIRRYRDRKFMMERLVRVKNFIGQKGQTLHVPLVGRMSVRPKVAKQPIDLDMTTPGAYMVSVDQQNYVAHGVEDITNIQSQYNVRNAYSREIGYALRRDLDNALLGLRAAVPTQLFSSSTGTVAGVPQPMNADIILAAKEIFDRASVPEEDRHILVGPQQYRDLLDIERFISSDFIDGRPTVNGVVGRLYDFTIHMTNQIQENTLTGYVNGEGAIGQPTPGVLGSPYMPTQDIIIGDGLPRGQTGNEEAAPFTTAVVMHPEWACLLRQTNIVTKSSYDIHYLSDIVISYHVFGAKTYRRNHAILLHTGG